MLDEVVKICGVKLGIGKRNIFSAHANATQTSHWVQAKNNFDRISDIRNISGITIVTEVMSH
jgi:hypothetical protein